MNLAMHSPITIYSAYGYSDNNMTAISGLSLIPNFITGNEERQLIVAIDQQPWITELKRRVQHYGYRYDYKARNVTPDLKLGDIPDWLTGLCHRLQSEGLFQAKPDQIIVNEYQPGQGIAAHIDCVPCFGESIASLSLASPCVMDFTDKADEKIPVLLKPRSLVLLSGDARYQWRHSIAPRKTDKYEGNITPRSRRLSLTFRNVRLSQKAA